MGDRLATTDTGQKLRVMPLYGGAGFPAWGEAYLRTKWYIDPFSRLATINMGGKVGAVPPFWGRGSWVPI